jgi:hypothetical protein
VTVKPEPARFAHDIPEASAARPSARQGNRTVRAHEIASVLDLQQGACGPEKGRAIAGGRRRNHSEGISDSFRGLRRIRPSDQEIRACRRKDIGFIHHFRGAAGQRYERIRPTPAKCASRPAAGTVSPFRHGTRVHKVSIRRLGRVTDHEASRVEIRGHAGRFRLVEPAAEGFDGYTHCRSGFAALYAPRTAPNTRKAEDYISEAPVQAFPTIFAYRAR